MHPETESYKICRVLTSLDSGHSVGVGQCAFSGFRVGVLHLCCLLGTKTAADDRLDLQEVVVSASRQLLALKIL